MVNAAAHLARMTLREKCAQRVFMDFRFEDADYDRAAELFRKEGAGGAVLFGGSVFDVPSFVNWAQKVSKFPLLIAADYENGAGQHVSGATVFPPNMAVGATGSEDLAMAKGRQTALEARALGVRWVLGPVVDVNTNPKNPVINTRAFGDDPAEVARLARATLKGLRLVKVMGCAKHFPGHGDAAADSHLELPALEHSRERLRQVELAPYLELAADLDAVMAGHLLVKSLDAAAPVSLSRDAIEGLLRGELKFDGLVATDALNMGAIAAEADAAERAAKAGADVLLCPRDPFQAIGALEEAVKAGRLTEESVDRAVLRIFSAKERLGLFAERLTDVASVEQVVGSPAHRAAAQRIADAAVTLVRGSGRLASRVAFRRVGETAAFEAELSKRAAIAEDAEACVAAVAFRPRAFAGVSQLDPSQLAPIREARARYKEVTVVSLGSPYILSQFPEVAGYVCAYGEDEFCQRAAAKALAGEIEYRGSLPVKLEP